MASWKDHSRTEWSSRPDSVSTPSDDRLKIGCLQRIADAAELMAKSHATLVAERDRYKRWYEEADARCAKRNLSIAALRGVITKLKKKRKVKR